MTTLEIPSCRPVRQTCGGLAGQRDPPPALLDMADAPVPRGRTWPLSFAANAADMEAARGQITDVMLDRLSLTTQRVQAMASGIREVAALPDPVGFRVLRRVGTPQRLGDRKDRRPHGCSGHHLREPPQCDQRCCGFGAETRQCLCAALRQGSLARSAHAIVQALRQGMRASGLPETAGLSGGGYHPRLCKHPDDRCGLCGSADPPWWCRIDPGLWKMPRSPASRPVPASVISLWDESADLTAPLDIIENAKASRPSVCNAEEVCLVHQAIAPLVPARLAQRLRDRTASRTAPYSCGWMNAPPGSSPGVPANEKGF